MEILAFTQPRTPAGGEFWSTVVALAPVFTLLVLLAVFRVTAWKAVIGGSIVTVVLAIAVWGAPAGSTFGAYGLGALTGIWSVDWIVLWGVVIYNTLVVTGAFGRFKQWLIAQATADIRVQTILLAWAFGALLEGLVGFGYPWALVAPILIAFGVRELEAIRVGAIANNAPVSFGALGAPIIGLSKVTGLSLYGLAAAVGKIVAILALLPPWVLLFLVSGRAGMLGAWPLAVVGSLGYIAGQLPISQFAGPYLPDIVGALTCFVSVFVLLRFWKPRRMLGFGGVPIEQQQQEMGDEVKDVLDHRERYGWREALPGLLPFGILVAVVVAWTGPWSGLTDIDVVEWSVNATSSITNKAISISFAWNPFVAGTSILASWLLILLYLRPKPAQVREVFATTFEQIWGALLVGVFIFGLAFAFNYSGMAGSMAAGFSELGTAFIFIAPILGWIAVALSGSNTASNAVFGAFQLTVARLLNAPTLLFPSLNSVGAEVGKPVAPQTASVGVSTTEFVRNEGEVIRHNMGWTLIVLVSLIGIGAFWFFLFPGVMRP
jgi:lactate permease